MFLECLYDWASNHIHYLNISPVTEITKIVVTILTQAKCFSKWPVLIEIVGKLNCLSEQQQSVLETFQWR